MVHRYRTSTLVWRVGWLQSHLWLLVIPPRVWTEEQLCTLVRIQRLRVLYTYELVVGDGGRNDEKSNRSFSASELMNVNVFATIE
ncbi:hypothetical protein KXD40_000270 [Peronospora effusa]|nr:hypothetical protein KXD40_000270 [Peronospora effusa]